MKFDKTFALMIILLLGIVTVSGAIAFQRASAQFNFNPDITTTLQLTVTHNGQNTTRIVHDDLILDDFNIFIQGLLQQWAGSGTNLVTLQQYSGGNGQINMYSSSSANQGYCGSGGVGFDALCAGSTYGGSIYLGTGTKSVTRTVVSMQTIYGSAFNVASSVCNSGNPANVVVQASESAPSTASITEAGFADRFNAAGGGSPYIFLFTYETFTAVPVTNGDTISVQYTFNLNNAGVNRNFCNMLAEFALSTSTSATFTMYDTTGNSWTMCGWTVSTFGNGQQCNGSGASSPYLLVESGVTDSIGYICTQALNVNQMGIWMGTGTTTFGFSTTGLTSPVGATPTNVAATTYNSGLATSFLFITENTFNPASTTSVTESGLFINDHVTYYSSVACSSPTTINPEFLLIGFSFSPAISMPSGQNNALTFQISD